MKKRLDHWITVIAFCGAMAIMAALFLVLPERDFSETEKRYLEKFPTFSWEKLASGEFGADIETYMADHIPGRDFLVGLNAYFENVTGRQVAKDIYCAEDGRLVEKPVQWNGAQAAQNMMAINLFADTDEDSRQVQMLRKRIGKLGVFDRAIILLWLENLSYEEIGAIVGISAKNVSVRLVRIREQLKNMSNE